MSGAGPLIGFTIAAVVMTVLGVVALRSARRSSRRTGRLAGAWSTVVAHTTATDATHRWSVRSGDFWMSGGVIFTVLVVRWVGPDGRERRGVPRNPRAFSRQVPVGGRLALQFDTAAPDPPRPTPQPLRPTSRGTTCPASCSSCSSWRSQGSRRSPSGCGAWCGSDRARAGGRTGWSP